VISTSSFPPLRTRATVSPEAGVLSIHFIFRGEDHLKKAISDPKVVASFRKMIKDTVQGSQVLTLLTLGLRDFYSKKEIHNIADLKGLKIRVQATPTEDTFFTAYGAQVVHMPFGEVYTSLQTGVVEVAENGVNVYLSNKALRGGAGDVVVRARGERQLHLGQRQGLEQL
jgi:TRAP-type C4-dicarboxylate transport system substrate-binding protein